MKFAVGPLNHANKSVPICVRKINLADWRWTLIRTQIIVLAEIFNFCWTSIKWEERYRFCGVYHVSYNLPQGDFCNITYTGIMLKYTVKLHYMTVSVAHCYGITWKQLWSLKCWLINKICLVKSWSVSRQVAPFKRWFSIEQVLSYWDW